MAETLYPFKWYFRPEIAPVIVIGDTGEEYPFEALGGILAEIDTRHWAVIRQLLIDAKHKAEELLRTDTIIKDSRLSAYYQGWANYADYVLANFEGLRSGIVYIEQRGGPPEDGAGIIR